MCGRYWVPTEEENNEIIEILRAIQSRHPEEPKPTGLIVPTKPAPALTPEGPKLMRFGWKPAWMDKMLINARSETAAEKAMFAKPLREGRRCLLPASMFHEPSPDRKGRRYVPTAGGLLYMAGVYEEVDGWFQFVILTKAADDIVSPSHPRMPLLLGSEETRRAWLTSHELGLMLLESGDGVAIEEAG